MAGGHGLVTEASPATSRFSGVSHVTSAFNARLLYSCSVIALSQVNFGFDQGVFSATQAMTDFTRRFGVYSAKTKTYAIQPYFLSYLNSFTYIGFAFGLITGNLLSRRFGRRICMFVMCVWAVIAATVLVTTHTKEQMLVGRVIAYIYIGMELAVVPIFQSELAPAQVRGFVVGTYQSSLLIGQLIASVICRGTSDIKSDASWRIPLGLFYIIPCLVFAGTFFMPESPRWLLLKGRPEDALHSLRLVRQGRFSEEAIQEEFKALQITLDLAAKGRFAEMFRGTNLKRTLIVVGTNCFLQLTGQNFVSLYGTIFIKSLGTINPFSMSSINAAINIVICLLTMFLTDRTGRRPLMIAGAAIQVGALFAMGGLGTHANPSFSVKQGITAMVTIFGVGFLLGWAPLSHAISAEIPTSRLRDWTYGIASFCNICIQFAVSFSIPYLLYAPYANLGSKVGFIFGSFAVGALLFSYFCIPEVKGKTLEQIDELFLQGVPIRKFRHAKPVIVEDIKKQDNAYVDKHDRTVSRKEMV